MPDNIYNVCSSHIHYLLYERRCSRIFYFMIFGKTAFTTFERTVFRRRPRPGTVRRLPNNDGTIDIGRQDKDSGGNFDKTISGSV